MCSDIQLPALQQAARSTTAMVRKVANADNYALRAAATAALSCARSALASATISTAARSARTAADVASTVDHSVFSAVYADATTASAAGMKSVFLTSLWPKTADSQKSLFSYATFDGDGASRSEKTFWERWHQSFLGGAPIDWDLQIQIALIENSIWNEGPIAVAREIELIELRYNSSISPGLERDSSDSAFTIQSEAELPADILEYARSRISSALKNALEAAGPNGLSDNSYETLTICRALAENPKSASLLATGFYDACLSFESTIGERYPDDTSLTNLKNALWGVVEEINEVHPDARKRCARLAKLHKPPPTSQADQDMAAQVPDLIRGELSPEAQAVIESDVELILTEPKPPIGVKARFTNWVTTISMWMDKAKKGDQRAQWLAGVVERLLHWWDNDAG